jgi:hypothetical protein
MSRSLCGISPGDAEDQPLNRLAKAIKQRTVARENAFQVFDQRFYKYGDEDYEEEILRGAVEIRHPCDHNLGRRGTTYTTNGSETSIRKS